MSSQAVSRSLGLSDQLYKLVALNSPRCSASKNCQLLGFWFVPIDPTTRSSSIWGGSVLSIANTPCLDCLDLCCQSTLRKIKPQALSSLNVIEARSFSVSGGSLRLAFVRSFQSRTTYLPNSIFANFFPFQDVSYYTTCIYAANPRP